MEELLSAIREHNHVPGDLEENQKVERFLLEAVQAHQQLLENPEELTNYARGEENTSAVKVLLLDMYMWYSNLYQLQSSSDRDAIEQDTNLYLKFNVTARTYRSGGSESVNGVSVWHNTPRFPDGWVGYVAPLEWYREQAKSGHYVGDKRFFIVRQKYLVTSVIVQGASRLVVLPL